MVEFFKDLSEECVDKLSATEGKGLEIMANIDHYALVEVMLESYMYGPSGLNSRYVRERNEMLLRLSVSKNGRGRDDMRDIGKAPRFPNNSLSNMFGGGGE